MEETALTFRNSAWLYLLLIVPVFIALAVRSEWLSRRTLERFLGNRMVQRLASSVSWPLRRWRTGLMAAGIALVIFALAGPQYGQITQDREVSGIDVILAIDTSKSMLADDINPRRLLRAKLSALDLVKGLRGDRVGLIAFAGGAFLQAPMTIDHGAVRESIQELDSRIIPTGGTNIEDAMDLAVEAFGKGESGSKALVIYSDGEEWTADPQKLADQAREHNIVLYTIGVGTEAGSPITLTDQFGRQMYHRDNQGQIVHSRLDETFLRELANAGGGEYYHLGDSPDLDAQLLEEFTQLTRRTSDVTLTEPLDRYQWPLTLGIALLAMAFTISGRRLSEPAPQTPPAPSPAKPTPNAAAQPQRRRRPETAGVAGVLLAILALSCSPADLQAQDNNKKNPLLAARDLQQAGKHLEAYAEYMNFLEQQGAREYPFEDRVQYNAGRAAYLAEQYDAAIDAFSQSLLSENPEIQASSQYNLGNSLFRVGQQKIREAGERSGRPEALELLDKTEEAWESAVSHYESTLEIDPENEKAQKNRDFVEELLKNLARDKEKEEEKQQQENQQQDQQQRQDEQDGDQNDKDQEGEQESDQPQEQQQEEGQEQQEPGENPEEGPPQEDAPGDQQQDDQQQPGEDQPRDPQQEGRQDQQEPGEQGAGEQDQETEGQQGEDKEQQGQKGEEQDDEMEEPSPGAGEGEQEADQEADSGQEDQVDAPSVDGQPQEERPEQAGAQDFQLQDDEPQSAREGEAGDGAQTMAAMPVNPEVMNEEQARALLESLEAEEQRVPLLETRRARRSNTKDW